MKITKKIIKEVPKILHIIHQITISNSTKADDSNYFGSDICLHIYYIPRAGHFRYFFNNKK